MSASRPLGRSGVFRLRIAVSMRHFMKSTPTLSQARSYWTQSPAKPGSHAVLPIVEHSLGHIRYGLGTRRAPKEGALGTTHTTIRVWGGTER